MKDTDKTPHINIDSYVESFKKIHFIAITLALLVWLVASKMHESETTEKQLRIIDMIFMLNDVVYHEGFKKAPAIQTIDIPRISVGSFETIDDLLSFENRTIPNSYHLKREFFSYPGRFCEVGFFGGLSKKITKVPGIFDGRDTTLELKHQDLYLINIPGFCFGESEKTKTALLIKAHIKPYNNKYPSHQWFVDLSRDDQKLIAEGDYSEHSIDFKSLNHFEQYRDFESNLIIYENDYTYYSLEFFKGATFRLAHYKNNKIYHPTEIKNALDDLFNLGNSDANFLGVGFDERTFLNLSPLMLLVLLYELYRRIHTIQSNCKKITVPWIFVNIDNTLDFSIALIASSTPALCFFLINFFYFDSGQFYLLFSSEYWTLYNFFTATKLLFFWSSGLYLTYNIQKRLLKVLTSANHF